MRRTKRKLNKNEELLINYDNKKDQPGEEKQFTKPLDSKSKL